MSKTLKLKEVEHAVLLSLSMGIASIRHQSDLHKILHEQLRNILPETDITVGVYNEDKTKFRVVAAYVGEGRSAHANFDAIAFDEYPSMDGIHDVILDSDEPVYLFIEELMQNPDRHIGIDFIKDTGIKEIAAIRLVNNEKNIGFITLLAEERGLVESIDRNLFKAVAGLFSIGLANVLALDAVRKKEEETVTLLSVSNALSRVQNKKDLYEVINVSLKNLFHFKGFAVGLITPEGTHHTAFLFNCDDYDKDSIIFDSTASLKFDVNDGLFNVLIRNKEPVRIQIDSLTEIPPYVQLWKSFHNKSFIAVSLHVANKPLGCLYLTYENEDTNIIHPHILIGICGQLAMSISNIVSMEKIQSQLDEISRYKEQLEEERIYLQTEANRTYEFNEIIGDSAVMQRVLLLLSQVSATESTALILGETGTGKELIARAIHDGSPRKGNIMVKLNCSAIPANLIESELFGHEKGSFTGAIERRIGKFELANNGTLFLDEIGEMPVDMQAKLLRAIQEREIERVGGKSTIRINVRIVAATNRDLVKEVAQGKFRSDLYYRLNVFPILLPPLRERLEDIPLLVSYFMDKLSKKTGKNITKISERAMASLQAYSWPGNIRELEHLIERSMLVAKGSVIREIPLLYDFASVTQLSDPETFKTLEQAERDYIIQVLNKCNGKVFGPTGAAEILGLKRTTLVSKMNKLGITRDKPSFK